MRAAKVQEGKGGKGRGKTLFFHRDPISDMNQSRSFSKIDRVQISIYIVIPQVGRYVCTARNILYCTVRSDNDRDPLGAEPDVILSSL